MMEIDDSIDYAVPPETPSIDRGGIPAALDRANWHLRKLAGIHVRRHETEILFDAELARITERRDEELAKYDRAIDWHERPLRELHAAILVEDATRKSIVLPHGTLKSRRPVKPRLVIEDMQRLVDWAGRDPIRLDLLCPRPDKVRVTDLAKVADPQPTEDGGYLVLATGGEFVPGVTAVLGDTTYSVDLGEDI